MDSLGQSRRGDDDRMSRRLLTELLLQMTGAAQEEGVYVFAATNRLQVGARPSLAGAPPARCLAPETRRH